MNNRMTTARNSTEGRMMLNALFALTAVLTCLFFSGFAQASRDEGYERHREESKLYGIIDKMPTSGYTGIWVVGGRDVEVTDRTRIKEEDGRPETGKYVKVEGVRNGDRFTAYEIEVERREEYRSDDRMAESKLYGTIEALPREGLDGIWRISGRDITVDRKTRIKEKYGRVAVGAYAEVEGRVSGDTFTAYEIEIKNRR